MFPPHDPPPPPLSPNIEAELDVLREAFGSLREDLREANHLFRDGPNGGRDGVILALWATRRFLEKFKPIRDEALTAPLSSLQNALAHLDNGAVDPLLTPAERSEDGGRLVASPRRELFRDAVALIVRLLMATGLRKEEACRRVAETLHRGGVKAERRGTNPKRRGGDEEDYSRKITARTIRGWYDKAWADKAPTARVGQLWFSFFKEPFVNQGLSKGSIPEPGSLQNVENVAERRRDLLEAVARAIYTLRLGENTPNPPDQMRRPPT